jgi:hypothetical protein
MIKAYLIIFRLTMYILVLCGLRADLIHSAYVPPKIDIFLQSPSWVNYQLMAYWGSWANYQLMTWQRLGGQLLYMLLETL